MIRTILVTLLGLLLVTEPLFAAGVDAENDPVSSSIASTPGPVTRGSVLPVLYGTLAGLQAYDGWSTVTGVRRDAQEANRAMAPVASNPVAMWAVKAGATMASIYAAESLWRRHRRIEAVATMVAVNSLMATIALHNGSVVRGLR
jgi:hypothetical protein